MTTGPRAAGDFGPNVRRLIAMRMAQQVIPNGGQGVVDAVAFFLAPAERKGQVVAEATGWVLAGLDLMRRAAEPNPWKNADDEAIAGEMLRLAAERRKKAEAATRQIPP